MLSNLASYLGYQLAGAELEPDVAEDVNLCPVEDDEWLLVERLEMEPSVSEAVGTSASALPGTRSSMQESWYLTPPPSFSRGSVYMETSPLENLLIEHPSMSVYQKSAKTHRRRVSNSSRSASEEETFFRAPCEESPEKSKKLPRSKYSKKTSMKRPPFNSSDDALSLPSASEDEEKKEVKMKNFVKSPRRSAAVAKGHLKKPSFRRIDHSSSDEMISVPSNEEDTPTIGSLAIAPPRKLYSDVLRTKAKPVPAVEAPSPVQVVEVLPAPAPANALAPPIERDGTLAPAAAQQGAAMVVEEDRRRTVHIYPDQQRQTFLSRTAQKLEQRKTCELAKRSTLGRNNKAREMNSRNKRQRRSDMMQRHSGVNNNRKCY